jgi:hypothetical protein
MNRDDIIRMARETGFVNLSDQYWDCTTECIERFAALVAAAERDRIADETKYEKWVGLDLEEIDEAIAGNITITDPNLRDGVYGAIVDLELLLKEKNTHET